MIDLEHGEDEGVGVLDNLLEALHSGSALQPSRYVSRAVQTCFLVYTYYPLLDTLYRGKKRGTPKSGLNARLRSDFGSKEELDASNTSKANNYNTRTRQTKAQAMLARIQDKPPGTML